LHEEVACLEKGTLEHLKESRQRKTIALLANLAIRDPNNSTRAYDPQ
jgi:hypothetical protein